MAYRTQDSAVFTVSIIKVIEYVSEPAEGWGAHSKASEDSKCKNSMSFPYDTRLYYPSSSLTWDTIVLQCVGCRLGSSMVGLMVTSSKRCVTQVCCSQSPCPCGKPLLTHGSAAAATKSLQSCPTLCDSIDGSLPGPSVPGFSRQECWSGLPLPSPHASAGDSNTGLAQSLWNLCVLRHKMFCLSLLSIFGGYGVWV